MSTTSEKSIDQQTPATRNSTLIVVFLSLGGLSFAVLQSLVAPALSTIVASEGLILDVLP